MATTDQTFIVRGQVRYADGWALPDILVQAFDRDLRDEQGLGDQRTDAGGNYQISYQATQFARAEKASADLIVRAVNANGTVIARSPILFNAPAVATVDLVVSMTAEGIAC